jgi:methionyl-tRNA synthetase
MKNFYLTTPIYYVNDRPHIGHAYTSLACDIMARFKRLDGYNVKFLTGTDEHGQKVEKSAKDKGIDTQIFTDDTAKYFQELANVMNYSHDDFIRTTEERHKKTARYFWNILLEKGFIYKDKYAGWYAVRDEAYYSEDELVDGKAPTGAEVEWMEEESYFFKLSEFQDKLLEFYKKNPDFIAPKSRYNEVVSFVRGGKIYKKSALKDLSISRTSFTWGIKVPNDENHIIYVWLDALTNYLSALNYADAGSEYQNFWPANIHIVGKDILRFHAVYWPAFLMAAELPLPQRIFAHGWWTNEGEKISKSLGNVINPLELVAHYGLDQVRFFLMRQVTFGNDGDFAKNDLITRINSDLANNLGNLVQRTLAMVQKNCNALIPEHEFNIKDQYILNAAYEKFSALRIFIDSQNFSKYIEEVIEISATANEYIDKEAPWILKKTDPQRMGTVLFVLLELIRVISLYFLPIMHDSAHKILDFLAVAKEKRNFYNLKNQLSPGISLPEPQAIFPRIIS